MTINRRLILTPLICLALSACHFASKAPTGQVAATVDGKEITMTEVRQNLNAPANADPKQLKAAEQQALRMIVLRKLLAKAARDNGLDKTPEFAVQQQSATEVLLAQDLQKKIFNEVPTPSREEADRFIAAHPDIFAERKIFVLDQIRMARPNDPKLVEALKPLNTLDEVEALLTRSKVEFRRGADNLDAVGADPRMVDQIVKLPPDGLFIIPANGIITVNRIKESRVVPFTGDAAVKYATQVLQSQRRQEAISKAFEQIMGKGAALVKFNKEFQPAAAPAKPGASPAPATSPAPKPAG